MFGQKSGETTLVVKVEGKPHAIRMATVNKGHLGSEEEACIDNEFVVVESVRHTVLRRALMALGVTFFGLAFIILLVALRLVEMGQ